MISSDLVGIILALGSSVCFAGNRSFVSRPLLNSRPATAIYIGLVVGVILTAIAMVVSGELLSLLLAGVLTVVIFVTVGIFHLGVGRTLSYTSVKNIGANQTAPLVSTQILYSLVFGVAVLGENLNLGTALGAALVLVGVLLLEVRASASKRSGKIKVGYLAGLSTGLIFGLTPILIKIGLSTFHYYITATFITYLGSLGFYSLAISPKKIFYETRKSLPRSDLVSVVFAGVFGAAAQLLRFGALSLAPVVTVVPLLAAHPFFTILITRKLAKEYEVFHIRTLLAMVSVIVGTVFVSYSSGIVV
jgi:drug/metabolite transporter (DMT)-like permease